jgi:hypothetical protein
MSKGFFPRVKWPEFEDDHSSPSSTKVKDEWGYTSLPPYASKAWRGKTFFLLRDEVFHNMYFSLNAIRVVSVLALYQPHLQIK